MNKRSLSDDEIGFAMILLAIALLAATLILTSGCQMMPERVIVRGPHGTKIAEANTQTGDVRLTQYGVHILTPKIQFPEAK